MRDHRVYFTRWFHVHRTWWLWLVTGWLLLFMLYYDELDPSSSVSLFPRKSGGKSSGPEWYARFKAQTLNLGKCCSNLGPPMNERDLNSKPSALL